MIQINYLYPTARATEKIRQAVVNNHVSENYFIHSIFALWPD